MRGFMRCLMANEGRKHQARSSPLSLERLEDRSLMAAADLTAFRPVTQHLDYTRYPVAAEVEDSATLGAGIRMNGDDDNANGVTDLADVATSVTGDNDLVRVDVTATGDFVSLAWTGPLVVWSSPTKGTPVVAGTPILPGQYWVEYASTIASVGASAVLTLTSSDGLGVASDSVAFHSFQSLVIAIGGNQQDPALVDDPQTGPLLGMFTIGRTLYQQGYDVQLYAYSQVQSTGRGAAYDEIVNAVLKRNVDNVAIYGYSWGAGSTYLLTTALQKHTSLAPAGFKLQYTAYVDGIRSGSISAETRKPLLTTYHDNIYQRKDWLLKGNAVSGAVNINATNTTWGKTLVHTTLDDNATLQSIIVTNLKTKLGSA